MKIIETGLSASDNDSIAKELGTRRTPPAIAVSDSLSRLPGLVNRDSCFRTVHCLVEMSWRHETLAGEIMRIDIAKTNAHNSRERCNTATRCTGSPSFGCSSKTCDTLALPSVNSTANVEMTKGVQGAFFQGSGAPLR